MVMVVGKDVLSIIDTYVHRYRTSVFQKFLFEDSALEFNEHKCYWRIYDSWFHNYVAFNYRDLDWSGNHIFDDNIGSFRKDFKFMNPRKPNGLPPRYYFSLIN
jgi:hypothetical protein